ncbi:UNVERIFIED_CONTAM: hypothetical protein Sradi_6202000 [Sesamum radiatum]|uniref:Integrase catalytic domain-containing protein n=1 Tax=Sesamum radiatum TaxID=300843 RepID=A0AAW2KAC6_SESRA
MRIKQRFTTVANPQANGQVEVTNRILIQEIRRRLERVGGNWAEELTSFLWAYQTIPRGSTSKSPFSLVYGTEAIIPAELGGMFSHSSFTPEEAEASSLAASLMRGIVTPEDRRLLVHLGREDMERKVALHLLKGLAACETLFSRYQGVPPIGETVAQKAEERAKRLEKENTQLREAKREAATQRAQIEKELRRLSKTSADHEKTLRQAVEKAVADYPNSEARKNCLEVFWASKLDEYKKSEDFQKEVAQVAFPFVGYGFNACKEQFLAHRPPPAGEEFSFLDVQIAYANAPDPFAKPSASEKEDLPQDSAIDSSEGGAFGEGKTEKKKEDAPAGPSEGPSNDPPALIALSECSSSSCLRPSGP